MFDFPASPAEGQLFTPSGGPLYKFTNGVWAIPSTPPVMSISDTAPVNPIPGQLWWRSSDGASFVWFDDGTSKQWVQFNISASVSGARRDSGVITLTNGTAISDFTTGDWTECDITIDGLSSAAANQPFLELIDTSGVVGGTNYSGVSGYFANASASVSGVWPTNILALWPSAIVPATWGLWGLVTLRKVAANRIIVDGGMWTSASGTVIARTTGVMQLVTPPLTGIRFGTIGGNIDGGTARICWR